MFGDSWGNSLMKLLKGLLSRCSVRFGRGTFVNTLESIKRACGCFIFGMVPFGAVLRNKSKETGAVFRVPQESWGRQLQ